MRQLEARRDQVKQALAIEETTLNRRLETAIVRLRNRKPELFIITMEDQVTKLTVELTSSFIQWLIE